MQIKALKRPKKVRHSVTNAGPFIIHVLRIIREPSFFSVHRESPCSPYLLFLHKLLGSSELVSHHAQELLAFLQYIQVNQRNLHQRII